MAVKGLKTLCFLVFVFLLLSLDEYIYRVVYIQGDGLMTDHFL